jgi:hypothetical protein
LAGQTIQIWNKKTKKRPCLVNDLDLLKKELWSINFAKKSKKTPKNKLQQAPSTIDMVQTRTCVFMDKIRYDTLDN